MTHRTFLGALTLATLLSSAALAQTVQVREQSSSVVHVYIGGATTPRQIVNRTLVTFQDRSLEASVVRSYTSFLVDGDEKLANPVRVLIRGKLGAARSYEALTPLTTEVKEHLEKDLAEDRFLPLLETTPTQPQGSWQIPLSLASRLLERSRDSFQAGSKAGGLLRTRDDEGTERQGADFRFELHLNEITESGLRLAQGSRIDAQVRLEPSQAGLMVAMQSTLRGRGLAIRTQALPPGTRIEATTAFRRDYTQIDEAGTPRPIAPDQPLSDVFATFLGRTKSEGLSGSLRGRR